MPADHAPAGPGGGEFVSGGGSQPAPPSPNLLSQGNETAADARVQDRAQDAAARAAARAAAAAAKAKLKAATAKPKTTAAKPKATAAAAKAPTFAQLQQWEKDAQEGKPLTASQRDALHAAHEAHLAHEEHLAATAKGAGDGTGDDDFTELTDAVFNRVDLVGKGANGIPRFLIAKQDQGSGLFPSDYVRGLIAKAEPEEAPVPEPTEAAFANGIVLKGSPAAMAAFIHAASVRDDGEAAITKAKYDADDLKRMAASGAAMKDESYPIGDEEDLGKAVRAVGRGGASHDAIRKHIITRAKSLGASSQIPDNWNSDGSLKSDVSKEAGVGNVAKDMGPELDDATGDVTEMDPTVPLAEPEDMAPGDPTDPGSPAWESIDAASAGKWLSIAARLKNALCVLAEREMTEAAVADPDDAENAWDLQDAMCAVDFVIEQLAVFAAGEQMEADLGAEMADVGKALAGAVSPVGVIEGMTAVQKAGRVLSAANEAKLRSAAQAIGEVLSSLPQAPDGVAKSKEATVAEVKDKATSVAKDTASPEAQAADTGPVDAGGTTGMGEPRDTGPAAALPADGPQAARPGDVPGRTVVKSAALKVVLYDRQGREVRVPASRVYEPVAKADSDAGDAQVTMQAVFDAEGNLVGIVDPADITPVSGASKPGDDSAAAAPDAAPAAAADDMTPQPPADAGTPADDTSVAKATENVITLTEDVLKGIAADAAKTALEAQQAAHAQVVAKMAADNAGLAGQLEQVTKRLAVVEEHPAAPKVFTSGQVPPAHQLRGQDQGSGQPVDVTKARALKETLYRGTAAEQNAAFGEMQQMAVDQLAAMRRR